LWRAEVHRLPDGAEEPAAVKMPVSEKGKK
jgi:hypothetical protein